MRQQHENGDQSYTVSAVMVSAMDWVGSAIKVFLPDVLWTHCCQLLIRHSVFHHLRNKIQKYGHESELFSSHRTAN
jgi:hypothetical protein